MYQCAWDDLGEIGQRVLDETRHRLNADLPITVQPFYLAGTDADAALRLGAARSYSAHRARNLASLRKQLSFAYLK